MPSSLFPLETDTASPPFLMEQRFPPHFVLDRPYGSRRVEVLFLHFREPASVQIDRHRVKAPGFSCLFLTPGCGYRITSEGKKGLCFDALHIPGDLTPQPVTLGLPTNQVFQPVRTDFIPFMINAMRHEMESKATYSENLVQHSLAQMMYLLARYSNTGSNRRGEERDSDQLAKFQRLREAIIQRPEHLWTVDSMAADAGLSRSRFSSIFSELFGESPRDFLIHTRLRHAIVLITNTSLPLSEVAEQSGFQSPYYFSRIFNKRIGCPPSKYADRFQIP